MNRGVASLLMALALGACASAAPAVTTHAAQPVSPGSFRLLGAPSAEAAGSGVEREVVEALTARGFQPAGAGAQATYLVEAALGDRPRGVAAAVSQADGGSREIVSPPRRSLRRPLVNGARTLVVRIVERDSGRELYAASATQLYRRPGPADVLVDAALKGLGADKP
jgi:hypothetical protein